MYGEVINIEKCERGVNRWRRGGHYSQEVLKKSVFLSGDPWKRFYLVYLEFIPTDGAVRNSPFTITLSVIENYT